MNSIMQLINTDNIAKVFRNFYKVGPITTIRYIVSDLIFDLKYKIDTINTAQLENLEIDSPNKAYGNYYEGTNAFVFQQVFSRIQIDYSRSCIVDFGSGKGKAMFLAAELGFARVIGVEFSGELVEICRKNLEIFRNKSKSKTDFEIIHMDATEYPIPSEANVLFFSNPFNEALTARVIANILKSYERHPREIWVIHLYPHENQAFAKSQKFQLEHESRQGLIFRLM